MSRNIIVITGASSGIGMEFALQMDHYFRNIDEFWLIARDSCRLKETARALRHKTRLFSIDVTDSERLNVLENCVIRRNAVVRMLINCAGYGIMGSFSQSENSLQTGMIRVNCQALTELTHRMIPYMRPGSRIIQMASSAAFLPQPDFAVYAATKSYVLSFSRALGTELKEAGISVTAVCPGPVDTPFFDIAEASGSTLAVKKYTMVSADRVVALALKDSYNKRSVSVCSLPMKSFMVLCKIVPHGKILKILSHMKKKGL